MHDEDDIPWNDTPLIPEIIATIDAIHNRNDIQHEADKLHREEQEYIAAAKKEAEKDREEKRYAHLKPGRLIKFTEAMMCELPPPDPIIQDMFNRGNKMLVVGHSKTKKTFFVTQLAFSIATGTHFLGFQVPKKRNVLVVQYEVQSDEFLKRVRRMAEGLSIDIDDVEDRLMFISAKGIHLDLEALQTQIELEKVEVVIFDPFYKMFEGDESDIVEVKAILKVFDRITTKSKCGLIYVHHDKKGSSEKTEQRDRGAGSGVIARDYDCSMAISEHDTNTEAVVIDFGQRNYRTPEPITAEWVDSHFIASELQPVVKKAGRRSVFFDLDGTSKQALSLLDKGPMNCQAFREALKSKIGASRNQGREIIAKLIELGLMKELPGYPKSGILKRYDKAILADELTADRKGQLPDIPDRLF